MVELKTLREMEGSIRIKTTEKGKTKGIKIHEDIDSEFEHSAPERDKIKKKFGINLHGFYLLTEELKQEAIKLIKDRQARIKKLEKNPTEDSSLFISQNEAVIIVFKYFFNVKESDLK